MNHIAPKLFAISTLILGALLGGCASTPAGPRAKDGNEDTRKCSSTLEEFCAEHGCRTYDQAVARTHTLQTTRPTEFPWRISVGTCGSLRFVTIQEGMGVSSEYFDASGALVSMAGAADAHVCPGSFSWTAGGKPSCEEKTLEHDGGGPS